MQKNHFTAGIKNVIFLSDKRAAHHQNDEGGGDKEKTI
jgi:hypothetical protein